MKKQLIAFSFVIVLLGVSRPALAQYNNWAVGFRLGEPSGINVRKYFGDNRAFDLNVGTFGGLYGNRRAYRQGAYKSVGLSIQGHYLWHTRLFGKESLRGYYGFGGQINRRKYYPDNISTQPVDFITETSLGGSAVGGIEYFPDGKPFSVFLEIGRASCRERVCSTV